ncbi:MAG: hypothetical protein A2Z29_06285 [Chloroflexi bacterium RBG_16_56_11]|nr:MAG: hypothetical protein A2Z29_06285 [Chloroflexi bacterium RBG_16_56_11]
MADVDKDILASLDTLEKEEGSLPRLLQFFRELLNIQAGMKEKVRVPRIENEEALRQRLEQGLPLLDFNHIIIDMPLFQEHFARVVSIYSKYPDLFGEIPAAVTEAGRLISGEAVIAWLTSGELPAAFSSSPALAQSVFLAVLRPWLVKYATSLASLVDQDRWRRRVCPVCGGVPDFSFLDKERGSRWLVCSRCDTEWAFQRLECPWCGCQEPGQLAYLADDQELYRVYTCQCCRKYVKTIDLRKTEQKVLLPLERLLTLDLDRQAQEKGFTAA